MTAMPTRIEADLYDAAKTVGATMSRSAAQQINHWARIGRELEAAQVNSRDIEAVLAGRASYDTLTVRDQALVRAEWDERIAHAQQSVDLEAEFTEAGQDWVEADLEGNTVLRQPAGVAKGARRRRTT